MQAKKTFNHQEKIIFFIKAPINKLTLKHNAENYQQISLKHSSLDSDQTQHKPTLANFVFESWIYEPWSAIVSCILLYHCIPQRLMVD